MSDFFNFEFLWTFAKWKWIVIIIVVLLGLYVAYAIYNKIRLARKRQCIDQICKSIPESESIFVSIASYRDPQCAPTLFDLFEKAACPFRITVGVCQQNYPVDEDVLTQYKYLARRGVHDFSSRIRVLRMSADDAQGPMLARSLIEKELYRGEKYYMIIDSHMMFTPDWDVECVRMLKACTTSSSPKPILTMYPDDFRPYQRIWTPYNYENRPGSYLRWKKFNDTTGLVEVEGPLFKKKLDAPSLGMFWGGCFSFGYATQINEVPYDPHCNYVFLGEEISMAARLWTSGYDLYHPNRMVVYHMWTRDRPTFWQQLNGNSAQHEQRRMLEKQGYDRLKALFGGGSQSLGVYGLGTVRTLDDYQKFIGIELGSKRFTHLGAILGLTLEATQQDVIGRFGTWGDYKKVQESVAFLVKHNP